MAKSIDQQMVQIPKGVIALRDDRTKNHWTVSLDSFFIHQYPVTQQFYFEMTRQSPSSYNCKTVPVENVSWIDEIKFCNANSEHCELQPAYKLINESNAHIGSSNSLTDEGLATPSRCKIELI